MGWQEEYQRKLVSLTEAAGLIESGDSVFFSPMQSTPFQLLEAIADRVGELKDVDMQSGVELYPYKSRQPDQCSGIRTSKQEGFVHPFGGVYKLHDGAA